MKWQEITLNEICTTQYGYTASAQEEEKEEVGDLRVNSVPTRRVSTLLVRPLRVARSRRVRLRSVHRCAQPRAVES
jgi:hypothetical protein